MFGAGRHYLANMLDLILFVGIPRFETFNELEGKRVPSVTCTNKRKSVNLHVHGQRFRPLQQRPLANVL